MVNWVLSETLEMTYPNGANSTRRESLHECRAALEAL